MSIGIIQEVMEKWKHDFRLKNVAIQIEQELIEKIKDDFKMFNTWDRDLIKRILIGDSNE